MAYKVKYKCRRCEKVETEGSVPTFLTIIKIVQNTPDENNPHFRMVGLHNCSDGIIGVTDFVGADKYSYGDNESEGQR